MTESYASKIATSKFWKFIRILLMWKGSIYKMVWFELLLFGILYSAISLIYRFVLKGSYKLKFEEFCVFCDSIGNFMPIAFILSFYITMIASRWWNQFHIIPWPDQIALSVNTFIIGNSIQVTVIKKNIVRYLNLSLVLFLRSVSTQTKKRFPEEETLVEAGLLSTSEFKMYNEIDSTYNRYHIPLIWATNLAKKAYIDGHIKTEGRMNNIICDIVQFRERLNQLHLYDWVNPPLVYTQTATIAVYTYFITSLFSRQFLDPSKNYINHNVDLYVPVFFLIQLVFYFGWLKVGECLINPFGEDDADFDCLGFIDRNLTASFVLVNLQVELYPELMKDAFYDTKSVKLNSHEENVSPFS